MTYCVSILGDERLRLRAVAETDHHTVAGVAHLPPRLLVPALTQRAHLAIFVSCLLRLLATATLDHGLCQNENNVS